VRPGEALGAGTCVGGHTHSHGGVERKRAQCLGQRERVAGWGQHTLDPVARDVAIAGDVGGDHRRAGGERLGQDHPEALAVQRWRAQHVGAGELGVLARLGDLAERVDAAIVEHHVRDLLRGGADERERRRDLLAQRLERAQQHRQPLAFDGLADEQDPQGRGGSVLGSIGKSLAEVDPVGHDPVAAAIEAPRGPGGGLGDGDADVQVVHPPPRAERGRDPVRERVLGVGVEGADERQLRNGRAERVPAEQRHDRLVDVHDVVAALAQLATHREHRWWDRDEVRDGAVGGEAGGAAKRDEMIGCPPARVQALGARAPVQTPRERVVGVERREDAGLVTQRAQLPRKRLDVACDPAGVRPRIRRKQRDSHGHHSTPTRGRSPAPRASLR